MIADILDYKMSSTNHFVQTLVHEKCTYALFLLFALIFRLIMFIFDMYLCRSQQLLQKCELAFLLCKCFSFLKSILKVIKYL